MQIGKDLKSDKRERRPSSRSEERESKRIKLLGVLVQYSRMGEPAALAPHSGMSRRRGSVTLTPTVAPSGEWFLRFLAILAEAAGRG